MTLMESNVTEQMKFLLDQGMTHKEAKKMLLMQAEQILKEVTGQRKIKNWQKIIKQLQE